ncbi:MAG: hypothetical protein ACE5EL_02045, partial [Anaerolineae bacterium]
MVTANGRPPPGRRPPRGAAELWAVVVVAALAAAPMRAGAAARGPGAGSAAHGPGGRVPAAAVVAAGRLGEARPRARPGQDQDLHCAWLPIVLETSAVAGGPAILRSQSAILRGGSTILRGPTSGPVAGRCLRPAGGGTCAAPEGARHPSAVTPRSDEVRAGTGFAGGARNPKLTRISRSRARLI